MSGDIAEATHEEAEVIVSEGGSVFSQETAYSSLPNLACPGIRDVPIRSGAPDRCAALMFARVENGPGCDSGAPDSKGRWRASA